jgi:large subunit ribosomal protein L10
MPRSDKAAAVAELAEQFRSSNAAVLTEYRGLSVAQLKALRRELGDNAQYAIVKNTLTKIAARQAGFDQFETLLQGPSAIAFVKGDPVEAAKGLRDFARTNPLLVIKGGVLEGRALSPDEIRRLADLELLLGRLAGAMLASLSQAAALFQEPLSQAARVIEALRQKAEEDPSILAGGAGTPAAAPSAVSEVAADAAAAADAEPGTAPASAADSDATAAADAAAGGDAAGTEG